MSEKEIWELDIFSNLDTYITESVYNNTMTGLPTAIYIEQGGKDRKVSHNHPDLISDYLVGVDKKGNKIFKEVYGNPRVKIWPRKGEKKFNKEGWCSIILEADGKISGDENDLQKKKSDLNSKDLKLILKFIVENYVAILELWNDEINYKVFESKMKRV